MQFLTQEQFKQKIRDGEAMGIPRATVYEDLKSKGYEIEGEPNPKPTVEQSGGLLGYLNTTLQSAGRELGTVVKTTADFAMNPSHAVGFGRDIIKGGASLAVGAAENAYEAVTGNQPPQFSPGGAVSYPAGGTDTQQVASQVGKSAVEAVSNPLDTFKNAPLSTLSIVAPAGGGLLNKAAGLSKAAGMAKTAKGLSTAGKVVGALDPINAAKLPGAAVKYAPKAAQEYMGLTTGAGGGATKLASQAKTADSPFFEGMRGDPLTQARKLQEDAQQGLSALRQRRSAKYQATNEAMRSIMEPMSRKPIGTLLDKTLDDFRITRKEKDILDVMKNMDDAQSAQYLKELMATQDNPNALSPLVQAGLGEGQTAGKISRAINYVENWDDYTPDGLDRLQKSLSTLDPKPGSVEHAFITRLQKGVKQQVKDKYPEYTKMMSDYHDASDFLDEIQTALGGRDVKGVEQAVRKMSQSMKTGNQGFEIRNAMLAELEQITGVQLRQRIAGMALNQIAPRGLAGVAAGAAGPAAVWLGLVNPSFVLGLALSSPRVVGEILGAIGVAKTKIPAVIQKLRKVAPPELLQSMKGPTDDIIRGVESESRLIELKGGQKGRPGIDKPAPLPQPQAQKSVNVGSVGGVELTTLQRQLKDAKAKLSANYQRGDLVSSESAQKAVLSERSQLQGTIESLQSQIKSAESVTLPSGLTAADESQPALGFVLKDSDGNTFTPLKEVPSSGGGKAYLVLDSNGERLVKYGKNPGYAKDPSGLDVVRDFTQNDKTIGQVIADSKIAKAPKALPRDGATTGIPKELEPLAAEARKYKSAEEFVKAQTDPLFEYKSNSTAFFNDPDIGRGSVKDVISDMGGVKNIERGRLDISKIEAGESNISINSERGQRALSEIQNGVRVPIAVDPLENGKFLVLDGNHRLAAYKALGIKDVPVIAPKGTVSPSLSRSQLTDIWKEANRQSNQSTNVLPSLNKLAKKFKTPEDFIKNLKNTSKSSAPKELVKEIESIVPDDKGVTQFTNKLTDIWYEATGTLKPAPIVRGQPTPIPGTDLFVEDLPF